MDRQQLQELKDHITHHTDGAVAKSIEVHVNGKIRALTDEFRAYVKEDTEWKKLAQPSIDLGKNIKSFGLVSLYLLGAIAAAGAALAAVKEFFFSK